MNLLSYPSLPNFNNLKRSWITYLDSWILFNPVMKLIWKHKMFDIIKSCWYLYAYGKGLTIWAGVSGGNKLKKKNIRDNIFVATWNSVSKFISYLFLS